MYNMNITATISGAFGVCVASSDELDNALAAAIAHDGPALVEAIADPDLV